MSTKYLNNNERQCWSGLVSQSLAINSKGSYEHYLHKLICITSYTLLIGSTSAALLGCQASPVISSAPAAGALIDFNIADNAINQAQGHAFTDRLQTDSARYEQLFDQNAFSNSDSQAKTHLLAAIRQHLATEQVAVARANYHMAPFIDPDSIDAGASSLLRTIIETYAYQEERAIDEEAEDDGSDFNDDTNNEAFADDSFEPTEEGLFSEYPADIIGADYDEDYSVVTKDGGFMSSVPDIKPKALLKSYEAMQQEKQQPPAISDNKSIPTTGVIGQMLGMLHRTPEQIAATNVYQYQNLTFGSVSQYSPQKRQLQSVYSYDYVSPTLNSSIQIPLAFDFNESRIAVDPSAIMPIMALINPEKTPLPNEMASHTVSFGLPDSITAQLPPPVLYDAVINAVQNSMAELAPEHFSAVDIRNDTFAKEVGASRAVKVYFGSKQSGEMIGKTLKYMTQSLQDYVDANPQKYPDGAMLKEVLAKLQLYNKGYQSADVGALLQMIEAIGPISFNQINHYYLDQSDRLLAKQQQVNIGSDLMGATTSVLNQVRYDKASFNNHALTSLLAESFGANAKPAIDGNAWMADQRQQKDRLQAARYARYDYDYDANYDTGYDYDHNAYIDTEDDTGSRLEDQ